MPLDPTETVDVSARPPAATATGDVERPRSTAEQPSLPPGTYEPVECVPLPEVPGGAPLSRYEVEQQLDEGGMGRIHIARDKALRRRVVIKELKPEKASERAVARFVREMQITAQLDHPNVVPIYNVLDPAEADGARSFTLKYVQGETLGALIKARREAFEADEAAAAAEERDALRERLEHFVKACDAIRYAHSRNVSHCDLKPANLMIGPFGEVYVMDWGIAYSPDVAQPWDDDGDVTGTPAYMAPEQVHGVMGPQVDVYAMGLVLFELAALKRAIGKGTLQDTVLRTVEGRLEPLEHICSDVSLPPDLAAIVARATARAPQDRYPDLAALEEDVRRFLRGEEVSVRPDNAFRKAARWVGEHRVQTLVLLLVVLAVASGLLIYNIAAAYQAERESRQREARLARFQAGVAERGHRIDGHFQAIEAQTLGLAETAALLLAGEPPAEPARLFSDADFAGAGKPSDTAPSPVYGDKAVSLDHPVYKLAPSADEARAKADLQRLAPLRRYFLQMLLRSGRDLGGGGDARAARLDWRAVRPQILTAGVPLRWAYVGLASGVMFSFPGKAGYPADFDPRKRPWYQLGATANGAQWGRLYLDTHGQGLLMPCAAAIFDQRARFLGVAGAETTLSDVVEAYMAPAGEGFVEAYLLDAEGRVVVRTRQVEEGGEQVARDTFLEGEPFRDPALVEAARTQRSGVLRAERDGRETLLGYQRLPAVGWTYVEEVDAAATLR